MLQLLQVSIDSFNPFFLIPGVFFMQLKFITPQTQDSMMAVKRVSYMAAVAIAAGFSVPVPVSPVTNFDEYVKTATSTLISKVIGVFNEVRPVDINETIDFATRVYKARYEVAHGLMLEQTGAANFCGVLDLFGIGLCLTKENNEVLHENAPEIMLVLGAVIKAARQITTEISE